MSAVWKRVMLVVVWNALHTILLFGLFSPVLGYKHFSTKTPYAWGRSVYDKDLEDQWFNDNSGELLCSAIHTSVVARHGTRYPGQDDVKKLTEIHRKILNDEVKTRYPGLYAWRNPFPDNNNKALASLGEEELESYGKRTAQRLFSLFAEEDIDSFRYITSSTDRTRESSRAFFEGLTSVLEEDAHTEEDEYEPEVMDKLLRFHTQCDNYVKSVGNNKTAMKEYYTFLEGKYIATTKRKISEKLGITEDTLSPGDIRTLYLGCGYESAIFEASPWCQLLDEEDMIVQEYLGDLKHYYKNGAGHDITWKQACPLVSDIFYTMDDAIESLETMDGADDEQGYIIGQFAFGHAETLGPLYTALGLFNDTTPLRADNFKEHEDRLFRSSLILPFGANLQLILYECEPQDQYAKANEDDDAEHHPEYFVKLLVNEEPQLLPGCDAFLCPYSIIRDRYKAQVENCNFGQICRWHPKDEL